MISKAKDDVGLVHVHGGHPTKKIIEVTTLPSANSGSRSNSDAERTVVATLAANPTALVRNSSCCHIKRIDISTNEGHNHNSFDR
jgi:hypothetical protein